MRPHRPSIDPFKALQPLMLAALAVLPGMGLLAGEEPVEKTAPPKAEPPSALPEFPLKSQRFSEVIDEYEEQEDAQQVELWALEEIVAALKASTPEHLSANVAKDLKYRELMLHPKDHRGQVVRLNDVLRNVVKYKIPKNKSGVEEMWRGQITNSDGYITSFLSLEPPAEDLTKDSGVQLVGAFLKRYAFLNNEPGEKLTWSPLVFVARLEPYTSSASQAASPGLMWEIGGGVLFLVIGVFMVLFMKDRMKNKKTRANVFSIGESGREPKKQGVFPRPNAPRDLPKPKQTPPA